MTVPFISPRETGEYRLMQRWCSYAQTVIRLYDNRKAATANKEFAVGVDAQPK